LHQTTIRIMADDCRRNCTREHRWAIVLAGCRDCGSSQRHDHRRLDHCLPRTGTSGGIPGIIFDAQQARQVVKSVVYGGDYIRSGVLAISQLENRGIRPKLWIIELGTNDVPALLGASRSNQVAYADVLIGQLLDTLGPDAQVAWVTVSFRLIPLESDAFNEALRRRAAVDSRMTLVDWHALSITHADWFADSVHPNDLGAVALGHLYVETVLELLDSPPRPPSAYPHAERLGMS
jgi:hypothetical protein